MVSYIYGQYLVALLGKALDRHSQLGCLDSAQLLADLA
jgi:hypothetical protein